MVVGERFWNTVDQSKLSTKVKNAAFGTLKKLFLKKADDERDYDPLAMYCTMAGPSCKVRPSSSTK